MFSLKRISSDLKTSITCFSSGVTISSSVNGYSNDTGQRREPPMPRTLDASNLSPLSIEVDPVPEGPELSFAAPSQCNGGVNPIGNSSSQCKFILYLIS